jgi:hypothetical protein
MPFLCNNKQTGKQKGQTCFSNFWGWKKNPLNIYY